jgi:hypothetical protein
VTAHSTTFRLHRRRLLGAMGGAAAGLAVATFGGAIPTVAQDDDIAPAPASIGADIPLTYFGPAPSTVQKELVGPSTCCAPARSTRRRG